MSIRVLIVDDNAGFRDALRDVLGAEGYEVADAPDGEAALRLLSEVRPHVVLMDVNMPGMSGIEATRRILGVAPDTTVVMLSMFGDEDLLLLAGRAGAADYLVKDARLDDILSAIRTGLQERRDMPTQMPAGAAQAGSDSGSAPAGRATAAADGRP